MLAAIARGSRWGPTAWMVTVAFGSWNAGVKAAGF